MQGLTEFITNSLCKEHFEFINIVSDTSPNGALYFTAKIQYTNCKIELQLNASEMQELLEVIKENENGNQN